MMTIDEDTATIRIYPESFPGNLSRADRELAALSLTADARCFAVVLSRMSGVVWKIEVKPYTGL